MYFGCNCQNEFRNLGGSCYKIPCKIVDYLLEDFGGFLRDLQNEVESMEDFMELITERIFEPMMEMTCECSSGLADAMFGCVRNYDAGVVQMMGQSMYDAAISMIDLDSMENVMRATLAMYCNEVGEEVCYEDFAEQMRTWGKMMDNSMAGAKKKDCSAFSCADEPLLQYIQSMDSMDMSKLLEAYYKTAKKIQCSSKCAEEQAETFYTCCTVEAIDLAVEHELEQNMGNIMDNISTLMSDFVEDFSGEMMSRKDLKKLFSVYNPQKLCGKKRGAVFMEKREQCVEEKDEF